MKIALVALAVAVAVVALVDSSPLAKEKLGNFQFGKQGDNNEQAGGDFLDSIKTAFKGIFDKAEGDDNKFGELIKTAVAGFFDKFPGANDLEESVKDAAKGFFAKQQGGENKFESIKTAAAGFFDKFHGGNNFQKNRERRDADDEEYPETSDAISRSDEGGEYPEADETSDATSEPVGEEYPEAVETSNAISGPVDDEEHNRERRAAQRGGKGKEHKKPEGGQSGHGHGGHGHGGHGKHNKNNATSTDVAPSVDAGNNEDKPKYLILPLVGDAN